MFLATAESYTQVGSIQLDLASQPPELMQFDISIFSLTFSKFYANIINKYFIKTRQFRIYSYQLIYNKVDCHPALTDN